MIKIQIFNILSEEVVPQPQDRLIHISLTSDMPRREIHLHGQDTMLNHNSVLMVIPSARKILVNVTVLPGTVELRMKLELELPLGINSECGHPFLRPKKTNILDATNIHSEKLLVFLMSQEHAGVSQNQTTFLQSALINLVTIASVTEELFSEKEICTLLQVNIQWEILVLMVSK